MTLPKLNYFKPSPQNLIAGRIHSTSISGLYYLAHNQYTDHRGYYTELALIPELEEIIKTKFSIKQVNQAHSLQNVARGLHAENWNKLATIASGTVFCALVDVRPSSETFGQIEYIVLGCGENALNGSIFISAGIANSYCVVDGPVDYFYAVDKLYEERDQSGDVALSMFDPDLNIVWPLTPDQMIQSDRDKNAIAIRTKFPSKFTS